MKIFCKSEPSSGCLYLKIGWSIASFVYFDTRITEIEYIKKNKLYVTRQGNFWKDRNGQLYRIHNYGGHSSTFIHNQNKWYDEKTNKLIMAEKIDYYELLLEDLFSP